MRALLYKAPSGPLRIKLAHARAQAQRAPRPSRSKQSASSVSLMRPCARMCLARTCALRLSRCWSACVLAGACGCGASCIGRCRCVSVLCHYGMQAHRHAPANTHAGQQRDRRVRKQGSTRKQGEKETSCAKAESHAGASRAQSCSSHRDSAQEWPLNAGHCLAAIPLSHARRHLPKCTPTQHSTHPEAQKRVRRRQETRVRV